MNDKPEQLTQAEKTQLEAELAQLEGAGRADVVQAIKTARAFGDLSENYEYHAAKNEQGLLERRITILQDRLRRAVVIDEADMKSDVVGISSKVTIEHEDGDTMDVEISSVGGVSPESPLGAALLGKKVGDKVTVKAPKSTWRATVTSITR